MNLKLSWKLALIGISSTVPLLCGTFFLINEYTNKDIRTAVLEQKGNRCLQPLVSLLETLPQHQAVALRIQAGDQAAAGKLTALQGQIDSALVAWKVLLPEMGPDLLEGAVTDLPGKWQDLKQALGHADLADRHARLVTEVRRLITRIGDTSNLILDPDLDSYYLMDVILVVLPQTQDRLARMMALGDELLRQPGLSAVERTQLTVQASQLKESDLDRLTHDVQTALTTDPNFHGVSASLQRNLPPAVEAHVAATEAFVAIVNRIAGSERTSLSPAEFEAAGASARSLSFKLWAVGARELDILLQKRIEDFNQARAFGMGLVALSLLLTIGVTVVVARSINRVERALRESEGKFSRAFRSGPDSMTIAELDTGRYLEVNEGFERLWGYSRAEALGRTSLELGLWRNNADREAFLTVLRTQGAVRDLECVGVNRRGESVVYLMSSEGVEIDGKRCSLSIAHDITDRKRVAEREREARKEFTRKLIESQETERRRIASGLHDSLGQNLLLIKNRAQLALGLRKEPAALGDQLTGIADLAAEAISEVRQISHDLRPYQLDQLGLTRALQAMIDAAAQSTSIGFTCKLDPVDDLFSPDTSTELYRVVQESLNNILKHSDARLVCVELEHDIHHIRLWIEDDGRGFADNNRLAGKGFGLQNITERVSLLGGKLAIDSRPGAGTRIEVIIPIPERPGDPA